MRKGFGRYGGDAFFDAERRIVKIELKEGPTNAIVTYRPGNRRWEYAKFVFRSTVFTMGMPPPCGSYP